MNKNHNIRLNIHKYYPKIRNNFRCLNLPVLINCKKKKMLRIRFINHVDKFISVSMRQKTSKKKNHSINLFHEHYRCRDDKYISNL